MIYIMQGVPQLQGVPRAGYSMLSGSTGLDQELPVWCFWKRWVHWLTRNCSSPIIWKRHWGLGLICFSRHGALITCIWTPWFCPAASIAVTSDWVLLPPLGAPLGDWPRTPNSSFWKQLAFLPTSSYNPWFPQMTRKKLWMRGTCARVHWTFPSAPFSETESRYVAPDGLGLVV